MTATAHALRPPVTTAAPAKKAAPQPVTALETLTRLPMSLGAIPAVQRRCEASREAEEQAPPLRGPERARAQRRCSGCGGALPDTEVMPQLEVGPVDDPFEREADAIAGRVMAMRAPGPAPSADPGAAARRRCAACAAKDEEGMARRAALPGTGTGAAVGATREEEEKQKPRMRALGAGGPPGTETIAASDTELTTGGQPLPGRTRAFYEDRMGHDLSGVRLHRGAVAESLTASISARAFTYRDHIWLGAFEGDGPSFTLAHELAHVVQQTGPGPAPPRRARRLPGKAAIKAVFAGKPYWTSKSLASQPKGAGTQIHEDVLEQFQLKHTDLFTETPISRSLWGKRARSGQADLYKGLDRLGAERTIGINFKAKDGQATNTSYTQQPNHSPPYNHATQSRPRVNGKGEIRGVEDAPVTIALGELKPNESKKHAKQLASYRASIERTRQRSNKKAAEQHADPTTPAPEWPALTISGMTVDVPDLKGKNGPSFGEHALQVRQFVGIADDDTRDFAVGTLIHDPPKPVKGHLRLRRHSDGVYYYWWEPKTGTVSATLPPDLKSQWPLTKKLIEALRTNRKVVLPRRRDGVRAGAEGVQARPDGVRAGPGEPLRPRRRLAPQVQRKSGNSKKIEDPFDKAFEANWRLHQKTVAKAFVEPNGTDLMTNHYLMEIDRSLEPSDSKGIERTQKAQHSAVYQQVEQYRTIKLIASPFAPAMARLRRIFGGVFVKASELYQKFKAKFDKRAKPGKSLSGGGILGALLRAAFKVLQLIGRQVVASTMVQLVGQLKGCMVKMFEDWFSTSETVEAVQEKVEKVRGDLEQSVETFIGGDPEQLAETLFGPYGQQIDTVRGYIETITDIAGPILTAYKVVRWGIQAVACMSPPALGCLWGLAAGVIEWAAGQIMDTCWFMKKVTPAILGIPQIGKFIQSTSVLLSNGILETVGGLLPDPVGSFVSNCKAEPPRLGAPAAETICDEEDGSGSGSGGLGNDPMPSAEAMAFWQRWENLPFAKQMALKKLIGLDAAKAGAKADWDKMNAMLAWAEQTDLAKIKELADKVAKGEADRPAEVAAVRAAAADSAKAAAGGKGKAAKAGKDTAGAADSGGGSTASGGGADAAQLSATRSAAKPEPGETAGDLRTFAFFPDIDAPAVKDAEVTGTVVVRWTKPDGTATFVNIEGVKITYATFSQTTRTGGRTFELWGVKPAKSESFHIEGRDGDFVLVAGKSYGVFVPKPAATGATP